MAEEKPLYTITRTVPIGTPDHWDLLTYDVESGRVYIAHGDRVTVVDGQSGELVGNIEGYAGGTHGFAIVSGSGHVFVVDSDPGRITVIDPKTDTVIATLDGGAKLEIGAADGNGKQIAELPIGSRTDGAAFDPSTKRAFSSNGDGTLTVIGEKSASSFVSLGSVPTMHGARTMTLNPKTGRLYLVAADCTVNESVDPGDFRHRYSVLPGSAKLLFMDPAPTGQ